MQFLVKLAAVVATTPAFFSIVSAQTWSACNPMKKDGCPKNVALSGNFEHIFGGEPKEFQVNRGGKVLYEADGAHFRVAKTLDSPTYTSNFYIMYGKVEVNMKAAPGAGIVSSVVLQSDTLDEVDWEWLGGKTGEAQSNYFGKGNTESYDRGAVHAINHQEFHTYGIEWTPDALTWLIDGKVIRTLRPAEVKGDFYPQTPMQIKLGSWSGGDPANAKGTIEWSGGPTEYNKGPFDMIVKSINIKDYSTGKYYVYGDKSGSAKSIVSEGGKINSGVSNSKNPPLADTPANKDTSTFISFVAPTNSGRVSSTTTSSGSTTSSTGTSATSPGNTNKSETTPAPNGRPSPSSPSGSPSPSVLPGSRPVQQTGAASGLTIGVSAVVGIAGLAAVLFI